MKEMTEKRTMSKKTKVKLVVVGLGAVGLTVGYLVLRSKNISIPPRLYEIDPMKLKDLDPVLYEKLVNSIIFIEPAVA